MTLPFVSRLIIVLPFIDQPRFSFSDLVAVSIGLPVLIFGFFFALSPVSNLGILSPFTRPNQGEKLQTGGFYGILRHPIMFGEAVWPFGWALIFKSIPGVLFAFVWLVCLYLFSYPEEERLLEEHGAAYTQYQQQVPRFFPRFRK